MTLLLVAAVGYYAFDFLRIRVRYYQISDEVRTRASLASVLNDNTIRNQLVAKADTLGLQLGPKQWTIQRQYNPRSITISAEYVDSVVIELPGVRKVFFFTFTPQATKPF